MSPKDGRTNDLARVPAIQSVARCAAILGFFTPTRPRLTLSEIVARLGTSKATAHRYAMAMRSVDLLRYEPGTATYTLSPQVLSLAAAARAALPITELAGPVMETLVRSLNETVVLSVWDGDAPVVLRVDDNADRVVRISIRTGARLSLLESAQGRVFLAFLPPEQVPGLRQMLRTHPDLDDELASIREHSIAVNAPGAFGVRTVATPVFDGEQIAAVIAVVGTEAMIPDARDSEVAAALRAGAIELSAEWGRAVSGDTAEPVVGDVS